MSETVFDISNDTGDGIVIRCGKCKREKVNGKCPACGRPPKWEKPEEVYELGRKYIDDCISTNSPITVTGLALALDTTRETLMNYQEKDEFLATLKKLKSYAEEYAEKQLYIGKNAAGPIFSLKNFGWTDKTETDITSKGEQVQGIAVSFVKPKE